MRADDAIRLRHMLEAAEKAVEFSVGKTRADLDTEQMLVLALIKCVEIIGEAVNCDRALLAKFGIWTARSCSEIVTA